MTLTMPTALPRSSVPGIVAPVRKVAPAVSALERFDPIEDRDWDRLVLTHPRATFFHSSDWARVLHATYGHRPCYLGRRHDGRLLALAAVMECPAFPFHRQGVGLPGADYCPVLSTPEVSLSDVVGQVLEHGRSRGWRAVEFRGMDGRPGAYPRSVTFLSHSLDLKRPAEAIHAGFKSCVRRAIRKAQREGVELSVGHDAALVGAFYRLHCMTRRRHGLPPQPFSFFRNIQREVLTRDHGFVIMANWKGRPIAGAILFHFGPTATYKFAASDLAFQQLRANDLVVWEAIRHLAGQVATLDFGRTSLLHEGLRRFKLGFGAAEGSTDYYQYDYRRGLFEQTHDWTIGYHTRLFGRLPLPLLRMVGNMLYRNMALGVTLDILKHRVLES